jgi:hypothetical protein
MESNRAHLLKWVGYDNSIDTGIFKKYLRMPKPYMKGMFQLYPSGLQIVPMELPSLLERCDLAHWGRMKMEMTEEEQRLFVKYKMARVPPMYMKRNELPACAGTVLKVADQLINDPRGFADLGRTVFFHSIYEDNALLTASNIVKSGVRAGLKCLMVPFTVYMEAVKTFETSAIVKGMKSADIAVMSMVGCEYMNKESGFTESHLEEFVKLRRMEGKSTIISSHLDPASFAERYKMGLDRLAATPFKFDDGALGLTIIQLGKELEEIRAKKGGK